MTDPPHPLVEFLTGSVAEVDTADVVLDRVDEGLTTAYVRVAHHVCDVLVELDHDDPTDARVRVVDPDDHEVELTRAEALDLARALLALVRELDVRINQATYDRARAVLAGPDAPRVRRPT